MTHLSPNLLYDISCTLIHLRPTISTSEQLGADRIIVVYGHGGDSVKSAISNDKVEWVEQKERLGTGHAVQQAIPFFTDNNDETVLILYGDVPLVREQTLRSLLASHSNGSMSILTTELDDPFGYGRTFGTSQLVRYSF